MPPLRPLPLVVPPLLRLVVVKEPLRLVTLRNRQAKSRPKVADSSPPAKSLASSQSLSDIVREAFLLAYLLFSFSTRNTRSVKVVPNHTPRAE